MGLDFIRPFPKRPRLQNFDYQGSFAYSITILTKHKEPLLIDQGIFDLLFPVLKACANLMEFDIVTYCFMPDHLHLLISGKNKDSDLKRFVSLFKQKSGYEFKKRYNKKLWHLSYYDHVLRRDEDITTVAQYILNNPVRKGLTTNFLDYPYAGSLVFNVNEW